MFQEQGQPQNQQQPAGINNIIPSADAITSGITGGITDTMNGISNTIADTKNSVQQSMNEFSSASVVNAGNDFLQSNSLIAKFGFIILVLFGFLFLFRIGMMIISSILSPSDSPYLVKGMISGTESVRVQQDTRTSSQIVNYSENQQSGLEFTYSVWILINSNNTGK